MILQALYQLCNHEYLSGCNPHYMLKKVSWIVRYGEKGRFFSMVDNRMQLNIPSKTKKGTDKIIYRPRQMWVPREPERTSGDYAFFLCDTSEYVFGMNAPAKKEGKRPQEKLANRHWLFKEKIIGCYEETGDDAIRDLLLLLERIENDACVIKIPEECDAGDLVTFAYAPDNDLLLVERSSVKSYWENKRKIEIEQNPTINCLVSGKYDHEIGKLPTVKKLPGGTPSGVALVSFNASAFESYGLKGNQNASISWTAAEKCITALNRLLDPEPPNPTNPEEKLGKRCYLLTKNTTVCYWTTTEKGKDFCDQFPSLLEANPDDVKKLYHSVWKGQSPEDLDPSNFFALIISGTQGRAIVRDWIESTVRDAAKHVAHYFTDIDIVRNTPKPKNRDLPPQIPLTVLLRSLAVRGQSDDIPPHIASELAAAALSGKRYPMTILHRALERMRAEIGDTTWPGFERRDARTALIKAVLARNFKREVKKDMDPNIKEPGYLLGRLLAVIERAQQEAMGDINATVIDRYFSGASASPGSVFPRLLKNLRNHIRKAKDSDQKRGTALWLDRQADDIMSGINGFPAFLSIDQQGLFILGYHHQRHHLWKKKSDREENDSPSNKAQGGV